ncbi:type VII secretion integral membrane protein EccD [Catenulispora yoronensis]|uniref:Type VII secretion integral membrane protein EccD n=1 Tax=Catenulispora yoronensis TaxID=450799 RepID=A0ABN2U664_9ACTN
MPVVVSAPSEPASRLCSLTVHTPLGVLDASVPADVELAEVLPALLRLAAERGAERRAERAAGQGAAQVRAGLAGLAELADRGQAGGGWVLQRLGGAPLDEDLTVEALGLVDGELLHLRPRSDQLPEADFDDLIDGVATAVSRLPDRWRPERTRALLLGVAAAAFLTESLLVLLGRPSVGLVAAGYGTALLLLVAGTAACRAFGDRTAGVVLGASAVPIAAAAGYQWPAVFEHAELASRILAAVSCAGGSAVFAVLAFGAGVPVFLGIAVAAGATGLGTLAVLTGACSAVTAAAAIGTASQLALIGVPMAAFRLGRRRLDPLPTGAKDLQEHIDPEPAERVTADVRVIDRYMTSLTTAFALLCTGTIAVLARTPGWEARTLGGTLAVLSLLHARVLSSAWQRLAVAAAGVCGATVLVVLAARGASATVADLLVVVVAVAASACVVAARTIPGRRLVPYWTSLADATQWLAAISLLPQVLLVTGFYHFARSRG